MPEPDSPRYESFEDRQLRHEAVAKRRSRMLWLVLGLPAAIGAVAVLSVLLWRDVKAIWPIASQIHGGLAQVFKAVPAPLWGHLVRDLGVTMGIVCESAGFAWTRGPKASDLPPLPLRVLAFTGWAGFIMGLEFTWFTASWRHLALGGLVLIGLGAISWATTFLPVLLDPRRARAS